MKRKWLAILVAFTLVFGLIGGVAAGDDDGLVAYWPFNEGDGDDVEDVVGDNDGEIIGAKWTEDAAPIAWSEYALEFQGDEQYEEWVEIKNIKHGSEKFTLSFWIYYEEGRRFDRSNPGGILQGLFGKKDYSGGILAWTPDSINFGNPDDDVDFDLETSLEDIWTLLTFTYDGEDLKLFQNDSFVDDEPLSIGSYDVWDLELNAWGSGYHFWGKLDDVRIYNYALDKDEVKSLYDLRDAEVIWLPPVSLEDFSLNENANLPIKFELDFDYCPDDVSLKVEGQEIELIYDEEEEKFIGHFRPDKTGEHTALVYCNGHVVSLTKFEVEDTAPYGRGQGQGPKK